MAEPLSDADLKSLWRRNELIARHKVGGKMTKTNANITIGEFDSLLKRLHLAESEVATLYTAENESLRARLETVEAAVESVARWAWRTDPPNATGHLTDTDRLSCIKHHPTIKKAAQPHIDLAEAEAARSLSQEGSDANR